MQPESFLYEGTVTSECSAILGFIQVRKVLPGEAGKCRIGLKGQNLGVLGLDQRTPVLRVWIRVLFGCQLFE